MKKLKNQSGYFCGECGHRKYLYYFLRSTFCLWCRKKTANDIKVSLSDTLLLRDNIRVRQKRKGFKKFVRETISGWFRSKDPRLSEGAVITRNIDKENNWYEHIVKDKKTGKIIHKEHEPLNQHKLKNEKTNKK